MTFVTILLKKALYFCEMKFFTVIILSLLLLGNSLRVSIAYGWYTIDIESFVENLCENKDKPKLQCNGKCYLTKITKDTSSDDNNIPVIKWEQNVYYPNELPEYITIAFKPLKNIQFWYLSYYKGVDLSSVFHPPRDS